MPHILSRLPRKSLAIILVCKSALTIGCIFSFLMLTACGKQHPPFALSDVRVNAHDQDGSRLSVEQILVEQIVPGQQLYFWASWCAPCIPQLMALNDTTDEQRKRYFLINIDEHSKDGVRFLEQRGLYNLTSVYWSKGGYVISRGLLGNRRRGIPLTMRVEKERGEDLRLTEVND